MPQDFKVLHSSAADPSWSRDGGLPHPPPPEDGPRGSEAAVAGGRGLRSALRKVLPERAVDSLGSAWLQLRVKGGSLLGDPMQVRRASFERECPICGYRGRFWSHGSPPRAESMCPGCLSLERHRLMFLLFDRYEAAAFAGKRVLHFAPEACVRDRLGAISHYLTADISGRGVDYECAIEQIPFPDGSMDVVIANHVLEHVDDDLDALREIRRVLDPGGMAVLSVPLIHGWEQTYENPKVDGAKSRRAHFGQEDHKRMYGADFVDRLETAGFEVEIFRADQEREVRYGLRRGEQFFIARPRRDDR